MRIDKDLLLASDLLELVKAGKKNATVRAGARDVENRENLKIIATEDSTDFVFVNITDVINVKIKEMTEEHLIIAGKDKTPQEYLENTLLRFYPDLTLDDLVTIFFFELA